MLTAVVGVLPGLDGSHGVVEALLLLLFSVETHNAVAFGVLDLWETNAAIYVVSHYGGVLIVLVAH